MAEPVIKIRLSTDSVKKDAAEINRSIDSIGRNRSLDAMGNSSSRAATQFGNAGSAARRMGGDLNAANDNAAKAGGSFSRLSGITSGLTSGMAGLAAGLAVVAGAFIATTRAATEFYDKMAEVSTLVDTATFDLDGLTDSILKQSVAFGKNPTQTAGAAYQIISAGASDATTAIEMMTQANMLAVGGVTSVETAADGLTSVVNAYGSDVLAAADASDSMFTAMKMGKTTIGELASNLGQVAPLAAQMGVSFDELNASVAALTKGGVTTSVAVTGVRAILAAVAKPTEEAKKQAAALGLEFNTAALKAQGFAGFLQSVKDKTGGSVDSLGLLFGGVEALVPMLALSGQAGVDFTSTLEEMKNKGGAAAEAYDKIANSPGFQLARVFTAIKVAAIDLGSTIAKAMVPALKFVADNFLNAFEAAKILLGGFLAFKAATLVAGFLSAGVTLSRLGSILVGLNKIIGVSTAVVRVFNAALMANPFIFVATAIGTTIALLYQFSDQIQIGTEGMGTLADFAAVLWSDIVSGLSGVVSFFKDAWSGITATVASAYETITSVFAPLAQFISPIVNMIKGAFDSAFGGISLSFIGIVKLMARGIDTMISGWIFMGKAIASAFANAPRIVGAAIRSIANGVLTGIETMINNAIGGINSLIGLIKQIPFIGGGLSEIGNVKLGRYGGEGLALGATMPSFQKGSWVEGYVDSVAQRADERAAGLQDQRNGKGASAATDPALLGGDPSAAAAGGAGKSAGSNAAKEADERLKKYTELLAKMRDEIAMAGMLKHEAEIYNQQLEAKKILGAAFGQQQADEIKGLVEQKRLVEAITGLRQDAFELSNESTLLEKSLATFMGDEIQYADELLKARLSYLNTGGDIANLSSEEWIAQEQALLTELKRNDAARERVRLRTEELQLGRKLIEDAGVPLRGTAEAAAFDRDSQLKALTGVIRPDGMGEAEFQRRLEIATGRITDEYENAMRTIARDFEIQMVDGIHQIGDALGGVVGKAINAIGSAIDSISRARDGDYSGMGVLGGIAKLFGGTEKNPTDFGKALKGGFDNFSAGLKGVFSKPLDSMASSFKSFRNAFDPAKGGSALKGIGNAVGGAMQGAALGSAVAGVGQMIWKDFSSGGAQIGGAVGSIFGPLGSLLGSLGGGIIGGIIGKPKKYGTAGITLNPETRRLEGLAIAGSGSGQRAESARLSGAVADGINAIAERLGADVTRAPTATIGTWDDMYRVSSTGYTGALNFSGRSSVGLTNFGGDSAAAISYAVDLALKEGILDGISSFSKRVLKAKGQAGVGMAESFEKVLKDIAQLENPLKAGAQAIVTSIDSLIDSMRRAGATAEELTKVEGYRAKKLAQFAEEQLSSLKGFQKDLMGEAGGYTKLAVLTRNLSEFEGMRSAIAAGETVDQSAFTSLGQSILSGAADVYGSTAQFTDIRNMLMDATGGLIANTTAAIDDATLVAINQQTDAINRQTDEVTGGQAITNDLLRQLLEQKAQQPVLQGKRMGVVNGRDLNLY